MQGDLLTIEGPDVNHIKNVLRMHVGEELSVSNGTDGKEYRYGIEEIGEDAVYCRLRFVKEDNVELPVKVTLYQGLPKADKMELIIQKCVELGVAEVVPVAMARCVVKLDAGKGGKKAARWQQIATSAAEQSKRAIVPTVREPISFKEAVREAEQKDVLLFPYELADQEIGTRALFESLKPGSSVAVFIGPEGGFAPEEVELAKAAGARVISLGKRILRTETAGFTVMAFIMYATEME